MKNIQTNKIILPIMIVICIIAVVAMIFALTRNPSFKPPQFDSFAVMGEPIVSEDLGYTTLEVEDGYAVVVCGNLIVSNGSVDLFLTSLDTNTVWIRAQLLDSNKNVLGETGVIKPGEYVQSLTLSTVPQASEDVRIRIIGYQPETWKSMGTVNLNTKLVVNP